MGDSVGDGAERSGRAGPRSRVAISGSESPLGVPPAPRLGPPKRRAGARDTIYQVPRQTTAAIVTSGPLCPGVNDVVRSLVWKLLDYGVPEGQILGIQRGFKGFSCKEASRQLKPIPLSRAAVEDVHLEGGTVLGTSSDPPDVHEVVKRLDLWAVDMLFVVGGYTDIKTAGAITRECARAHTFGFDTAVEEAQKALLAGKTAHVRCTLPLPSKVEASSAYRGVGLVKLFGRHSGFIAVRAAMSSGVVDVVLIPEARFRLDGDTGLLAFMEEKLAARGHIVVCVADGAGKDLLLAEARTARARRGDAADLAADADLIRSVPPTSNDRIYCKLVAHAAVHASFAAYTGSVVGPVNTHFCLLPISAIAQGHRKVDPDGELWNRMRSSIGQPHFV
eukprot:scaffold10.g2340.t1